MKLKIGAKIGLGYGVMLVLILVLATYSFISTKSLGDNLGGVDYATQNLVMEQQIEIEFYQAVSAMRGYIAYGRDTFFATYTEKMTSALELENQLLGMTEGQARNDVQRLIQATETYHRALTDQLAPAVGRQFQAQAAGDMALADLEAAEVLRIAGEYVPVTQDITDILQGLTAANKEIVSQTMADANGAAAGISRTSVILGVVALVLGIALTVFLTRSLRNPILVMVGGAELYAQGDFRNRIDVNTSDEVGDLARSLNTMADELGKLISKVIENAQTVAAHSEELAASGEEVSATVEEVASTTNQVAAIAAKSVDNANTAASESEKVGLVAQEGNETVKQTVEKINSISDSTAAVGDAVKSLGNLSTQIGNITNVITGIAEQTNLLALNAAIEAARAGEQGRGFAVVAEEVRKLAEQSAGAAKEITQLITQIQSGVDVAVKSMEHGAVEVNQGVKLASEAGVALDNITRAIHDSITLVRDIASGSEQTSEGTQQLSAANEQVTSTIQQISSASQELARIAGDLQVAVDKFKV